MTKIIRKSGFSELHPPTGYAQPGTVVLIESRNPTELSVICPTKDAFGSIELLESSTANVEFVKNSGRTIEIGWRYLKDLVSKGLLTKATLRQVEKVTAVIENAKVVEIPDTQVIAGLPNRSIECWGAIRHRQENRGRISMVKKALFADVFYQVEFHDRVAMDAEQETLVIDEIAASLGASREGKRILRGRNLYWGIVDDASMVEVAPEAYKANLVRRKGERAIPVNATVTVSPP